MTNSWTWRIGTRLVTGREVAEPPYMDRLALQGSGGMSALEIGKTEGPAVAGELTLTRHARGR